jgi:hypothetical protein
VDVTAITQNWILPALLAAAIIEAGVIWAARIRRSSARVSPKRVEEVRTPSDRPRPFSRTGAILIVGGAATFLSAANLSSTLIQPLRWSTVLFICAGWIAIALGLLSLIPESGSGRWRTRIRALHDRLNTGRLEALAVGVAMTLALSSAIAANYATGLVGNKVAAFCWGLGILLFTLGVWRVEGEPSAPTPGLVLGLSALAGVAFLLRGTATSFVPRVLSGDEGVFGLGSLAVLQGRATSLFSPGPYFYPNLFSYLQAIPIMLLGHTAGAIRLPSAVIGTLTVIGVFFLGRSMFGHRAGLLAAVFLTFWHYYIHFSRLGVINILDSLTYVVALGGLWQGWKTGKRTPYILAGLALGLGQYFYLTSRVLLVLVPLWFAVTFMCDRDRARRSIPNLVYTGAAFVLSALPLGVMYVRDPRAFIAVARAKGVLGPTLSELSDLTGMTPAWLLATRTVHGFLGYVSVPLDGWYRPGTPMLQREAAALFLLGLFVVLMKYRDSRGALLGLWVIPPAFLVGLSKSNPAAQRFISAAPGVALVVGLGLAEAAALGERAWPRLKRFVPVLMWAIMLWIALRDLDQYFVRYTGGTSFEGPGSVAAQEMAEYVLKNPDIDQILFFGDYSNREPSPSVYYLADGMDIQHMVAPWGSTANPTPTGSHLLFAFIGGADDSLGPVRSDFAGGTTTYVHDRYGNLVLALYDVSLPAP